MTGKPRVLVVDDQAGDIRWLLDLVASRGYEIDLATTKEAAMKQLDAVNRGEASYKLAIFDVMVAIKDLLDLMDLDEDFYEESRETGIELCRYARRDLGLSSAELSIVCLSAREDKEVHEALDELGIRLFSRDPQSRTDSLRRYVEENLQDLSGRPEPSAA